MDLTNQFLIAMPTLADPNFAKTVTYVYAHDEGGAFGIVINRPVDIRFSELLDHMEITSTSPAAFDTPVVLGGPVEMQRGFVLHERTEEWDCPEETETDLIITASREIITAIAEGRGPERALVALGYAGWAPGQLEDEVLDNAWLSGPCDASVIFDLPFDQRWERAAELMGIDVDRLSAIAGHS